MAILGNSMKPNKLGWVTSSTISMPYSGLLTGTIDFVANDAGALHEFMQDLRNGHIQKPIFQKEFMCLYCGSPNNVERTHCKKCGAPRSFVIG